MTSKRKTYNAYKLLPILLLPQYIFAGCPYLESQSKVQNDGAKKEHDLGFTSNGTAVTPPQQSEPEIASVKKTRRLREGTTDDEEDSLELMAKQPTFYLHQDDFKYGTYRITRPGRYVLAENISFAPNSANTYGATLQDVLNCCKPRAEQFESNGGDYPDFPYSLGFFAAITVEADQVMIDLNGKIIEQSKEHALMQRFFSVIELSSSPFIPGQGPRNFGAQINSGTIVRIIGGTIGRTSHHGIHGNGNRDVKIKDVKFEDFEVGAVALNGVKDLTITRCTANSRNDVPVMGRWSSGLFIHRYLEALEPLYSNGQIDTILKVQGREKTIGDVKSELEDSIFSVYNDLVLEDRTYINKSAHPGEYALFHNPLGIIDGNAYGFLLNGIGVAILGFPWSQDNRDEDHSKNVKFDDVVVEDLQASITEVIALRREDNGNAVSDPLGSVLQLKNYHPDDPTKPVTLSSFNDDEAEYIGNVITNAQLLVAKCIIKSEIPDDVHLPTESNQITADIIRWAQAGGDPEKGSDRYLSSLLAIISPSRDTSPYFCNTDTMFHVNKGIIGFKIDNTDDVTMNHCKVKQMINHGRRGSSVCGNYHRSHPKANHAGYGGANVRGFSFAGSKSATVTDSHVMNLISANGIVVGFDVMTDSEKITLVNCVEKGLEARGEMGPSPLTPMDACGVRFCAATTENKIENFCFELPSASHGSMEKVVDDGRNNVVGDEICMDS